MDRKTIVSLVILFMFIGTIGCFEKDNDIIEDDSDETVDDGLLFVPIQEIINVTDLCLSSPIIGLDLNESLELVDNKIHAFGGYEYDNITGLVTTQKGTKDKNYYVYEINGSLQGRLDHYWFLFYHNEVDQNITLEGEAIYRHGIPDLVRERILNITRENRTAIEFFEEYPGSHESYQWYSETDNRSIPIYPPIDTFPEFANSSLESNYIRASFSAPGGWIPELHPRLQLLIDLENNIYNITFRSYSP